MGEIYGGQEAGLCWKDYKTHVMVVQGGFEELYNMESTYHHPDHGVAVSVHLRPHNLEEAYRMRPDNYYSVEHLAGTRP